MQTRGRKQLDVRANRELCLRDWHGALALTCQIFGNVTGIITMDMVICDRTGAISN